MFSQIKTSLDEEDIEGLVAIGCPPDEYNSEAYLIESQIALLTRFGQKPLEAANVEAIVAEVWNEQFGPFSNEDLQKRQPAFAAVARKIVGS